MKDDLIGMEFGKLRVISYAGVDSSDHSRWNCVCSCGKTSVTRADKLKSGLAKSCGCGRITHHMTGTKTHDVWVNMIQRCRNKNSKNFHRYGGRGISVCDRWLSFENFLSDMGEKPDGLSIERINNDGNYEPSNCRWATQYDQTQNRTKKYKEYKKRSC